MPVRGDQLGIELFDDEYIQDPYPLYERMHAGGQVHSIADSGFYAVSGWDAVNEVIARPEDFSSNLTATMTYQDGKVDAFAMGELGGDIQALATADDPAHAAHRKLLIPQLAAEGSTRWSCSSAKPKTASGTKACRAAASSGCPRWPIGCR